MTRAQNSFVDEQLARIQTNHDDSCCYFADHKTMAQPRTPASTFEAICQHMTSLQPYIVVALQNDDCLCEEEIRTLYNQQVNQGGYFLLNMGGFPRGQHSTWVTSLGSWTNLPGLIRSFAEPREDLLPHYESARRVAEATRGSCHCSIPTNWIGATMGRDFLHRLANAFGRSTGNG